MSKAKVIYCDLKDRPLEGRLAFKYSPEPFDKLKEDALKIARQGYCYTVNCYDFKTPKDIYTTSVDEVLIDDENNNILVLRNGYSMVYWWASRKGAIKG